MGFRPFFLLGTASGALALGLWLAALAGYGTAVPVDGLWHAHEMIHGFAVAIVIGFLYTASANWTGLPAIGGGRLAAAVALWTLGRVAFLWPGLPARVVAPLDLAFLPVAACFLSSYLGHAGQKRNRIFLVLLGALWLGNLGYHLDRMGYAPGAARPGLYAAVYVVVTAIVVIGGRVIPFFSQRAIAGYARRERPTLDRVCVGAALAFVVASTFAADGVATLVVALLAAAATSWRLALWFDRRVRELPILAVLYAGYAWVPVGYALAALAALGVVPPSTALHAFTAGAISTMIVGMVSRVALGHTGRPLVASRLTVAAYVAVTASGLLRVFGPLAAPSHASTLVLASGGLWVLAMTMLLGRYVPVLVGPRVDRPAGVGRFMHPGR